MHKTYRSGEVLSKVRIKEYRLPGGKKVDFIDLEKKVIYELKPNNARVIKLGIKQLETYAKEMKELTGETFKTVLDTY